MESDAIIVVEGRADVLNLLKCGIKNAIAVDMALGCSTNTVLHIPAIAHEAGINLSLDLFNRISEKTPNICKLSPAGDHHIEDLDAAGGIQAVMKEISRLGVNRIGRCRPNRDDWSGKI